MAESAVTTASAGELGPSETMWAFTPTPKVDAGERSVAVAETYERVRRIARRVPITRVAALPPFDPSAFECPDATAYRPDARFSWVEGRELLTGRDVLVPLDLVISPPVEGILRDVDTNGLASGNIHLEAVTHAICEIIER